jgi:DNA-binding PadR family transcriptional regulator
MSVSDISIGDVSIQGAPTLKRAVTPELTNEVRSLLPLTPAVFYTLFSLADHEQHGYAIMRSVESLSAGKIKLGPGTLYTTIQRLLNLRLIEETTREKRPEELERRRRYYRLTGLGGRLLREEIRRLETVLHQARLKHLVPRRGEAQ